MEEKNKILPYIRKIGVFAVTSVTYRLTSYKSEHLHVFTSVTLPLPIRYQTP